MEADMARRTFGAVDYSVFGFMLVISAAIGLYYRFTGDRQKTTREYLLANRNMSVIPVAFSLMASFMSAVTLLGVPAENYFYGTQFFLINFSYIFGTPIAAYVFLPVFYQVQSVSAYEYLEKRFGKLTRLAASFTFSIQMILYMAVVLYAPALALSAVTGISKWLSIISVGIVCTFYSTLGGMKAVLWTDVFQSVLMFSSMLVVLGTGVAAAGGFGSVWNKAYEGERIEFFNFDPDPTVRHTVWTLGIGGIFVYVSLYGVNQIQVQRLLTVKSLKKAQIALFLNWPIVSVLSLITSFTGLVIYANFKECDPLSRSSETGVSSTDQILPYFVMMYLGHIPGLPGLFVAGIFSGALSSVSSAVNSLAAVTLEDFLRHFVLSQTSYDKHAPFISKGLALFYGLLCVVLTYVADQMGSVLQASFMIFGVVGGPLLGVFTLGMLIPKANEKGAVIGLVLSLAMGFWIGFGAMIMKVPIKKLPLSVCGCTNSTTIFNSTLLSSCIISSDDTERYIFPLYKLSYQWYAGVGWLVAVVVGTLVSLLTGGADDVKPEFLSPVLHMCRLTRSRSSSIRSSEIPMALSKMS